MLSHKLAYRDYERFLFEELIAAIIEKLEEGKINLSYSMIEFHLSTISFGMISAWLILLLQRRGDIEFHS